MNWIYFHLFSSFSAAQALKCLGFIIYHSSIVAAIPGMCLRYEGGFLSILTVNWLPSSLFSYKRATLEALVTIHQQKVSVLE